MSKKGDNNHDWTAASWNKRREEWLRKTPSTVPRKSEVRAKSIGVEELVEKLFSQNSDGVLPQAIPLGQMVDTLMEFWEADGFYE